MTGDSVEMQTPEQRDPTSAQSSDKTSTDKPWAKPEDAEHLEKVPRRITRPDAREEGLVGKRRDSREAAASPGWKHPAPEPGAGSYS